MRLRLPRVLSVDVPVGKDRVQQLESPSIEVEGNLATYHSGVVRGWLFQSPAMLQILIVPSITRTPPLGWSHVVACDVDNPGDVVDISGGSWLAAPLQTLHAVEGDLNEQIEAVLASWVGAFRFAQENRHLAIPGLRAPQIGALHALKAFWTVDESTATVVMPTGTGKTETMLSILVSGCCTKVLVVVPTDALRTQLLEKFLTLGLLKSPLIGVVSTAAKYPIVRGLSTIPKTENDVDQIMTRTQVCVTTSAILGRCSAEVQRRFAHHCPYLFIDEAHHVEAPTWSAFKTHFYHRRIVQFTATPFREDGKQLEGRIVFRYPLKRAQEEGYFRPITFQALSIYDKGAADRAIADAAVTKLREEWDMGHVLMARVSSVSRAKQVFPLYSVHEDLGAVEMHTGMSQTKLKEARRRLLAREARVVVCVDMLGEGFDMPELKIAAFHDIRKSLAITLQLAGRFTRTRPDLGSATFVANVADVDVQAELKKLYRQDPDWNVLLPDLSEQLIGNEVESQEFVANFGEFPSEIPLQAVRPATSTVIYRTTCATWQPDDYRSGIPSINDCVQVRHAVNEHSNVLVIVTTRRVALQWTDAENINSFEWELYVAYWSQDKNLLFINSSGNKGEFSQLASAITGGAAALIAGNELFRAFDGLSLVRFQNVGLREHLGRNVRYTGRMGGDVEPSITLLQRGNATKAVLAGTGYQKGQQETIGVSIKGRIWSHRRDRLDAFPKWCDEIGAKVLDATIDPDQIFQHCLISKPIPTRPDVMPLTIDWPAVIYMEAERNWVVVIDGRDFPIGDISIDLIDRGVRNPLRLSITVDDLAVEFELVITADGDASDFEFRQRGDRAISVKHGANAQTRALASFFYSEPPTIWFVDGSSLEGNMYTEMRSPQPAFDQEALEDWDWTGVDITRESQKREKRASIQKSVIDRLKEDQSYTVIFDDDSSGEAADVIAIRVIGGLQAATLVDVEFYHCKYSGGPNPGSRVDDLYEVCGQAQKSIWWTAASLKKVDLFNHMLKREEKWKLTYDVSRFEKGTADMLRTIQRMAEMLPLTLSIAIVQPGISKAEVSEQQLYLLGVTKTFIKNHSELPFRVITS